MGRFVRLNPGAVAPEGGGDVIKAQDYQVLANAEQILEAAREEAERIRQEALELKEKERQRGFAEGQAMAKMEMADQMITVVSGTVEYLESIEGDMVEIVQRCIDRILGRRETADVVVDVVRHALGSIRNEKTITLRVAPSQTQAVQARVDEIIAEYPAIQQLTVTPDSRLADTGAILECDIGIIDASLETQLAQLRQSFEKIFGQKKGGL